MTGMPVRKRNPWKRAGALAGLVAGLAGCPDAAIQDFDASLHYICPGQRVLLTWRVQGSATMNAVPESACITPGPVSDEGQLTIAPVRTTTVQLHVTRFGGNPTSSSQEIRVQSDASTPAPVGASLSDPSAGCSDGKLTVTARTKAFDARIQVASVALLPGDKHTYAVAHGGITDTIVPGAVSMAFNGTPILGDWKLTTTLLPGETCGTPTLPPNLAVDVITQCDPGASR